MPTTNAVIRGCLNCLAGALALVLVATTIRRLSPPFVPGVTPKLEYFAQHKDEFDTVFIGSSRILFGVSPKAFDETLRQAGLPSHSFNMGVEAMAPPESTEMAFSLLEQKPAKLRRVFMEVSWIQSVPQFKATTVRDIYWQNLDSLLFGFRHAKQEWHWAHEQTIHDLQAYPKFYAWNESNLGRGLDWLGVPPPPATLDLVPQGRPLGPDNDGFIPLTTPIPPEELAPYHDELQKALDGKWKHTVPLFVMGFDSLRRSLEAKGISLFYVVAPATQIVMRTSPDDCAPNEVFRFDDPAKYPVLFQDDRRSDASHLNWRGAREFSQMLGEEYSRRFKQTR